MNKLIDITSTMKQPAALLEVPLNSHQGEPANLASRWLYTDAVKKVLLALVQAPKTETATSLTKDKWGFGWDWWSIARDFSTLDSLYSAIGARRSQIEEIKNSWRFYIEAIKSFDPIHADLSAICERERVDGVYRFLAERVSLIADGISGSYFVTDQEGKTRFIVKPIDEDSGCLNNRKGFASPYTESTVRNNMTLYLSAMREALAYETSKIIGTGNVVPRTTLAILESDSFYDQLDGIDPSERSNYERKISRDPVREKLCSVQEFVPNSKSLFEGLHELQRMGLSDKEIAARFDQRDFEDANILLWCTYDTDGHMGNFLVYPKSTDAVGNEILGIKKIDSGLAFPEKNEQLRNNLAYLPNAKRTLSQEGRDKIAALSIDAMEDKLRQFGLDGSTEALRERLTYLKKLVAENPNLTLKEINSHMARIPKEAS